MNRDDRRADLLSTPTAIALAAAAIDENEDLSAERELLRAISERHSNIENFSGNPPDNSSSNTCINTIDLLELIIAPVDIEPSAELGYVRRAEIAHALNVILFVNLLVRVPSALAYVEDQLKHGGTVFLDHGAVRTVAWPWTGDAKSAGLPLGAALVARVLVPLGYHRNFTYDLTNLRMTGYSYTHSDLPETISQWFVSELHPDDFSHNFKKAVENVLATSRDPLDDGAHQQLSVLRESGQLSWDRAVALIAALRGCFDRIHEEPLLSDYEQLLEESAEMAWIATEGTSFNHATDRVKDIEAVAAAELDAGRPIKDTVEVSGSGRIKQTAHKATQVERRFRTAEEGTLTKLVPGSFFEFISRDWLPAGESQPESSAEPSAQPSPRLDLAFDAANAQGIFKMTDGRAR